MKKIIITVLTIILLIMIIISPDVCINGASKGVLVCGNIIVPSLFPFSVFVLFLLNCNIIEKMTFIERFSLKVFNQTADMFFIMLFSMLGGYPIGARLINELYKNHKLSKTDAHIMQCYCVNAGPAFIAVAIGQGILHSKKAGFLMLTSHIIASIVIALIFKGKIKHQTTYFKTSYKSHESISDIFVNSTAQAASAVLSICSFVILFSVITAYFNALSVRFALFKTLSILCEVTTSVSNIKNIYLISFLLGFSGFAVWFQVLSCSKDCGVNLPLFSLSRILHGTISSLIMFILLNVFKIEINTISNTQVGNISYSTNNLAIAFSLLIMVIMLIISSNGKNHSRKILNDVI